MRTGKLPEHTFKRSVINTIRYRSEEASFRAAVGHDGAVFGDMVTAMATTAFYYSGNELYALDNAINNVIAAGGEPFAVSVAILLPEHSEEAELRGITDRLAKRAKHYGIDIAAGHTELVPTVNKSTLAVTAYGRKLWANRHNEVGPGKDIVMTKWAGIYGGAILAIVEKNELMKRYPESYIDAAAGYMESTSLLPEINAIKTGQNTILKQLYAAHDVSNGGVFGALWQILAACNCGAEIPVASIPIKQETVEMSEFFNINPYMMNGQGSLIMIVDDGEEVVKTFNDNGVSAAKIGTTTEGKKRVVKIGDEERFLVAPKGDALNAVFYGQPIPV